MVTIHVCIHQLIKNSKGILSNGNFQNNFHALFEENCYIANINRKEEHKQLYDIHVYMDVYYHYHYVLYVSTYIWLYGIQNIMFRIAYVCLATVYSAVYMWYWV